MNKILPIFFFVLFSLNAFAKWEQVNQITDGDTVLCIATNSNYIFAGVKNKGVFVSTNNGESWNLANNGLNNLVVRALAANDQYVVAGTAGDGIFISSDNGNSWVKVKEYWNTTVSSLLLKDDYIFVGGFGFQTTFKKNDNLWEIINNNLQKSIFSLAYKDSILYAGTSNGDVYISSDYGNSRELFFHDLTLKKITSIGFIDDKIITATYGNAIFETTNSGINWKFIYFYHFNPYINCLVVKNNNIFVGTDGQGVILSNDKGNSWQTINDGLTSDSIKAIAFYDDYIFAGTSNKGLFRAKLSDFVSVDDDLITNYSSLLYPNPATDNITIESNSLSCATFTITNQIGQIVYFGQIPPGIEKSVISLTNLQTGNYYIRISNNNGKTEFLKFVKL